MRELERSRSARSGAVLIFNRISMGGLIITTVAVFVPHVQLKLKHMPEVKRVDLKFFRRFIFSYSS